MWNSQASNVTFGTPSTSTFGSGYNSTGQQSSFLSSPAVRPQTVMGTASFGSQSGAIFGGTPNSALNPTMSNNNLNFGASLMNNNTSSFSSGSQANGTIIEEFKPFKDKESASGGDVFVSYHSISLMPSYRSFSFEELQLQDYAAGRKLGNASGAMMPNPNPMQPQPSQQLQSQTTFPTFGSLPSSAAPQQSLNQRPIFGAGGSQTIGASLSNTFSAQSFPNPNSGFTQDLSSSFSKPLSTAPYPTSTSSFPPQSSIQPQPFNTQQPQTQCNFSPQAAPSFALAQPPSTGSSNFTHSPSLSMQFQPPGQPGNNNAGNVSSIVTNVTPTGLSNAKAEMGLRNSVTSSRQPSTMPLPAAYSLRLRTTSLRDNVSTPSRLLSDPNSSMNLASQANDTNSFLSPNPKLLVVDVNAIKQAFESVSNDDDTQNKHISASSTFCPPSSTLPRLYDSRRVVLCDYETHPDLNTMSIDSLASVLDLSIKHSVGVVKFFGYTDVRNLDINKIVKFLPKEIGVRTYGNVEVYPDDDFPEGVKPSVLKELNKPAQITLYNYWPVDGKTKEFVKNDDTALRHFEKSLKNKCKNWDGATFVSYDSQKGIWTFNVAHFTRYGIDEEIEGSDGEEGVIEDPLQSTTRSKPSNNYLDSGSGPDMSSNEDVDDDDGYDDEDGYDSEDEDNDEDDDEHEEYASESYDDEYNMGNENDNNDAAGDEMSTNDIEDDVGHIDVNDDSSNSDDMSPYSQPQNLGPSLLSSKRHASSVVEATIPFDVIQKEKNIDNIIYPILDGDILDPITDNTTTRSHLDMGLFLGRSFRVGWAPNGSFFHSGHSPQLPRSKVVNTCICWEKLSSATRIGVTSGGTPLPPQRDDDTSSNDYVSTLFRTFLKCYQNIQCPSLRDTLSREHLCDLIRDLAAVTPVTKQGSNLSSLSNCTADWHTDAVISQMTWSLVEVLWGRPPCLRNPTALPWMSLSDSVQVGQGNIRVRTMNVRERRLREEALSQWLERITYDISGLDVIQKIDEHNYLDVIWCNLLCHRISAACVIAKQHEDLRLALLLSQLNGYGNTRDASFFGQSRLLLSKELKSITTKDSKRLRIYKLLAGEIDDYSELNWKQRLGLYLWYDKDVQAEDVSSIIRFSKALERVADVGDGVDGILLDIMKIYIEPREWDCSWSSKYHLSDVLHPKRYGNLKHEFSLPWMLTMVLNSVYPKCLMLSGATVESVEWSRLVASCVFSLQSRGLWECACFVAASFPNDCLLQQTLYRCAALFPLTVLQSTSLLRTLVDAKWISKQMIMLAKGRYCYWRSEHLFAVKAFSEAGRYGLAYRLVIQNVVPEVILSGNRSRLINLRKLLSIRLGDSRPLLDGANYVEDCDEENNLSRQRLYNACGRTIETYLDAFLNSDENVDLNELLTNLSNLSTGTAAAFLYSDVLSFKEVPSQNLHVYSKGEKNSARLFPFVLSTMINNVSRLLVKRNNREQCHQALLRDVSHRFLTFQSKKNLFQVVCDFRSST